MPVDTQEPAAPSPTPSIGTELELFSPDDLVERLCTSRERFSFMVGSAISMTDEQGVSGVPGVRGILEMVTARLKEPPLDYPSGFQMLAGTRSQLEADEVIRHAVLHAWHGPDPIEDLLHDEQQCRALEKDLNGWNLPSAVRHLGLLVTKDPEHFGQEVLTSNFDPLVEIAIRQAGGSASSKIIDANAPLTVEEGDACQVIHFHGYWIRSSTLHTRVQLGTPRSELEASLARLLRGRTIVVVGYGGHHDAFMRCLPELLTDPHTHVIWCFLESDATLLRDRYERVLDVLKPGLITGRARLYGGVNAHVLFRDVATRHLGTPISTLGACRRIGQRYGSA